MSEPYSIKVHNLETCNCNHGCGCQFKGYPDHGNCQALLGYEVIEGHYGDTDLTGTQVVIGVKWPKAIHEGHGQAVMLIDESATPEQVQGLAMIFSGQAGGHALGGHRRDTRRGGRTDPDQVPHRSEMAEGDP